VPVQGLIDALPIVGVFLAFVAAASVVAEVGYRVGRWWQDRTPEERGGPTSMIVGSLLALMAFLLATTMALATDRYSARRALVLAEANAVGTTYLRAGFLPEPAATDIRRLLREYVPLRIVKSDLADFRERIDRTHELHAQLWSITEELARTAPDPVTFALFVEARNETIDLHTTRVTAAVYSRVPPTILLLLVGGSMLTMAMVGYNAGLSRRRTPLTAITLIAVLGAVITLAVDLDRPRDGFLRVNQQPLIDLGEQIGAP